MFFSGNNNQVNEKERLKPRSKRSITMLSGYVLLLNCYIGMGQQVLPIQYQCGIGFTTFINYFLALVSYYSGWMFLHVMKEKRAFTLEDCWVKCGLPFSPLISFGVIIPCIGFISYYFMYIRQFWGEFIRNLYPQTPYFVDNLYVVSLFLIGTVSFPIIIQQKLNLLIVYSYISLILIVIYVGGNIYWAINNAKQFGFDPRKELKLYDLSKPVVSCVSYHIGAYTTYIFLFFVLNDLENYTHERCKKLFRNSLIIFAIFNSISGISSYFVYFNNQGSNYLLSILPRSHIVTRVQYVLFILMLAFTIPTLIDPARRSALSIVLSLEQYPHFIWWTTGFLVMLLSLSLSSLTGKYLILFENIEKAMVIALQFILPGILLAKVSNGLSKIHFVGIVLFITIGSIFCVYIFL